MNVKIEEKSKLIKVLFVLITSATAITIISMTVGRELFEDRTQSITSFALIHFSGYLFFLLMPVEIAFIYYIPYFNELELVGVALLTATSAQIIDYLIGLSFKSGFLCYLVGEKRVNRAEKYIRKYGNFTIFLFNLSPLSSPVVAFVAGMIRYRFSHLMFYSITGLVFKYLIISLIF